VTATGRQLLLAVGLVVALGGSAPAGRSNRLRGLRGLRAAAAALALSVSIAPGILAHRPPFQEDIQAYELADHTLGTPRGATLFIGSSSVRMWQTLEKDFPGRTVINRGFGGSHLTHATLYAPRIVIPYAPSTIVVYAGSNDLHAGKTPETVAEDFKSFVRVVRAELPDVRIAYISTAPSLDRWHEVDRVRELNRLIAAHVATDPRLSFIDVFSSMLGADGRPLRGIYRQDGLHLNDAGYGLWRRIVGAHLDQLEGGARTR